MASPDPRWVADSDAVVALAAELAERLPPGGRLGVDTEFHSERRYHPELMLLQLAVEDGTCWLVDPHTAALGPLAGVLSTRTWVAHGPTADVQILHQLLGIRPGALLDTQVLAAAQGLGYPRRLDDLVVEVLGEEPPDGATLTDWARRPLSAEQRRYAAADARLALRLARALEDRLDTAHAAWAAAACDEVVAEALAAPDPDRRWKQLSIAPRFDRPTRAALHRLSVWREAEAQAADQPPHFVLPDGVLLDVARRRPTTVGQLAQNRRLGRGLLKKYGERVVALLNEPPDPDAALPWIPSPAQARAARAAQLWALASEAEVGVSAELLLPRPIAEAVVRDGVVALSAWRRDAIGDRLARFLSGGEGIFLDDGALRARGSRLG